MRSRNWPALAVMALVGCGAGSRSGPAPDPAASAVVGVPPPKPVLPAESASARTCEVTGERAFSPDGANFAIGIGREVVLFDTQSWKARGRIRRTGTQGAILFGPDGRYLLTADEDSDGELGTLRVHRTRDLVRVAAFEHVQLRAGGDAFGFSRDGASVLVARRTPTAESADFDGSARNVELWTLEPLKRTLASSISGGFNGFILGDRYVAFGGRELVVHRRSDGKQVFTTPYTPDFRPVFSPDGQSLAFAVNNEARLWNGRTGKTRALADPDCDGQKLQFSRDGKLLAVGGFEFLVCVFETSTGRLKTTLPNPRPPTDAVEDEGMRQPELWSDDARTLVVTGLYGLDLFDVSSGRELAPPNVSATGALVSWNQNATRIFVRKRDRALLVAHLGVVQARVEPSSHIVPVEEPQAERRILAISDDGERFARDAEGIEIVDTESGRATTTLEGTRESGEKRSWPSAFDPTGRMFFTTSGELSLWDARSGKRIVLRGLCEDSADDAPNDARP